MGEGATIRVELPAVEGEVMDGAAGANGRGERMVIVQFDFGQVLTLAKFVSSLAGILQRPIFW